MVRIDRGRQVPVTAAAPRISPWPAGLAWALAMLVIATMFWLDRLPRQADRADLVQVNAGTLPWLLALVSAPTVGTVLASRRPRHPVGWLLLGLGDRSGSWVAPTATSSMASWRGPGRSQWPAGSPSTAQR
jgi:hypothetical protein